MSRCTVCGEPLATRYTRPLERESGPVVAAAGRLPFASCPSGHYRVDPVSGWSGRAPDRVRASLHAARSRLLRPDACGACDAPLTMPPFRSERAVTLTAPTATLRLSLPLVRCTECAVENVPSDVVGDVDRAVRDLLLSRGTTRDPDGR